MRTKQNVLLLFLLMFATVASAHRPLDDAGDPFEIINKAHSRKPSTITTVCLDAGHGGRDSGAKGRRSLEKNIALEVVLKLGKKIEKELPGVKVIYTRTTDVFVDLYARPAYANKHNADLFISVHLNSFSRSSAVGTETLVSGFGRLSEQDVAIRENASILLEENYEENYGGFDPNDPSTYIVFSLMKREYRDQSIKLASLMQEAYTKNSKRVDRGVKEQSLAVLATAGMPAVLTEIGFISNPSEEEYMMSARGQAEIVQNIFNSIKNYKNSVERK